jgi:L-amino acid N-acyltransferase YncA
MSHVTIRPSRPEDVPAITAIYAVHVREGLGSFELEPPDAAEIARRRQAVLDAGLPHLVAEVDGRVIGYSYAGAYRPRPAYGNTVENSVYVAAEGHRRGVGRALLAALIEGCAAAGKRQASIELHRAMGFREVGTLNDIGYKHGRWVDSVLMQRPLGPGSGTPPEG